MKFYQQLTNTYHEIFPVSDEQIHFIQEYLGNTSRTILDIACGDGGHAIELAQKGYIVTAIDSSHEMIMNAKEKAELANVEIATIVCKMDEITEHITGKFDGAFCVGNAIVHLDTKERIADFLNQLRDILNQGAKAIIQIVNYDRILKYGINELPTIKSEADNLLFERKYTLDKQRKKIVFETKLNSHGEVFEDEVEIIFLESEEIRQLLKESRFDIIKEYGAYSGEAYHRDNSIHYICVVKKI